MDSVLIDTDVFSFLFKGDTRGQRYTAHLAERRLCVSFMSVAELHSWAIIRGWGASRRRALASTLNQFVVLPYDAQLTLRWAEINAARSKLGKPIGCGDCWIAATALRFGLPLVTHNARDYRDIAGLTAISEADA